MRLCYIGTGTGMDACFFLFKHAVGAKKSWASLGCCPPMFWIGHCLAPNQAFFLSCIWGGGG
jgi:hypothetical protein